MVPIVYKAVLKSGVEVFFNEMSIYTAKNGEQILSGSNSDFSHKPTKRKHRTPVVNICPMSEVDSLVAISDN